MQLTIVEIYYMIVQRMWLVALCVILGVGGAYSFSKYVIKPQYASSAALLVRPNRDETGFDKTANVEYLTYAQKVVDTYIVLLTNDSFLDLVAQTTKAAQNGSAIKGMIKMNSINNTEVFRVTVTAPSAQMAYALSDTITRLSKKQIQSLMEADDVKIVQKANLPIEPTSPNIISNSFIGGFFGLVLAIGIIFLIQYLDVKIRDEEDIIATYNLPVLGAVPRFNQKAKGRNDYGKYGKVQQNQKQVQ